MQDPWGEREQADARRRGWYVDPDTKSVRTTGDFHPTDAAAQANVAMHAVAGDYLARRAWLHLCRLNEAPGTEGAAGPVHRLCYVMDGVAHFVPGPVEPGMGGGWHKLGFIHNSDPPYGRDDSGQVREVREIRFEGPYVTAQDMVEHGTYGTMSVNDINAGGMPWMVSDSSALRAVTFQGGMPLERFVEAIEATGGTIVA